MKEDRNASLDEHQHYDGFIDARAKTEFWRMAAAAVLVSFMSAHVTVFSLVFARAGYDLNSIGLLLSLYAFPILLMSFLSGAVAARLGVLNTCRLSVVLGLAGFFPLQFALNDFWAVLACRMVQGLGYGLYVGAFTTYAQSRLTPKRFIYFLSIFATAMPLSQAFAPPFGVFVLDHWGPNMFFTLATLPALIGLMLTFLMRPLPLYKGARGLGLALSLKRDRIVPLGAIFVNGTMFGFTTSYLAAALQARGLPLAAFFIASTTTLLAGRTMIVKRVAGLDRRALIGLGFLFEGVSFSVMTAAHVWWLISLGGIFFGIGYSVVYPLISAWMSEGIEPNARAGPQGLMNMVLSLGIFLMPYPVTLIIQGFGYTGALGSLAALALTAALVLFGLVFWRGR
jgi:MFS family permease